MDNQDRDMPDQLEEHSLPGTNQAGKPIVGEERAQENSPDSGPLPEQLEEHSLPGTNQAGKDIPLENAGNKRP